MSLKTLEAMQQIAFNLTRLREQKRWSIQTLAVLSGVAEKDIVAIEGGRSDFDISLIFELAEALNVDFLQIFTGIPDQHSF